MNTTTIPAEALEVGSRFGYDGEFVVTAIGPEEDGIFHVRFDHAGTPKSRFMSVGERIIVPGDSPAAALADVAAVQLVIDFEAAVTRCATLTGPEWLVAWAEAKVLRRAILDRLVDGLPPF